MIRNLWHLEAALLNLPATDAEGNSLCFDMDREWHNRKEGDTPACGIGGWVLAKRPDLRRNWWMLGGPRTGESALRAIGCTWKQAMDLEHPRRVNRFGDFADMPTYWITARDAAAAVGNVRTFGEPFWDELRQQARMTGREA